MRQLLRTKGLLLKEAPVYFYPAEKSAIIQPWLRNIRALMSLTTLKYKNLKWINIVNPDEGDLAYLGKNFRFHSLDLEDVFEESQRSKMDVYRYYIFLILHFPQFRKKSGRLDANQTAIFIEKGALITVQRRCYEPLDALFKKCGRSSKAKREFFSRDSGYLLYKILDNMYDNCLFAADSIGRSLNSMEKQIFGDKTESALKGLALARRNILTFRLMIDPQRFVINALAHADRDFLPRDLEVYFDDVHDSIEKIWSLLENYKEVVEGLHDTSETLISFKTNAVIKVLTVISVGLLPLTLFSGIYGMNIAGLPFAKEPVFVWGMMGAVAAAIFAAIAYFKNKNWL